MTAFSVDYQSAVRSFSVFFGSYISIGELYFKRSVAMPKNQLLQSVNYTVRVWIDFISLD